MGRFTKEMINDYADKLLIGLTEEENKMVLEEFDEIDRNIDLINEIPDIENVEPMSHCLDNFDYELREDVAKESVPEDMRFINCDSMRENEVKVPKVVE